MAAARPPGLPPARSASPAPQGTDSLRQQALFALFFLGWASSGVWGIKCMSWPQWRRGKWAGAWPVIELMASAVRGVHSHPGTGEFRATGPGREHTEVQALGLLAGRHLCSIKIQAGASLSGEPQVPGWNPRRETTNPGLRFIMLLNMHLDGTQLPG